MKREQTTIRMPADLKERLQREAEAAGFRLNAFALMILADWLKHKDFP